MCIRNGKLWSLLPASPCLKNDLVLGDCAADDWRGNFKTKIYI